MASQLEEMEAGGWRFRGTDWLGRWEYEPCTPAAVRWAVAYAPSRRNWRLAPTEAERDLEDLCFGAGWRKVAALSKYHIYRNEDPDCTPLESDELPRLDTMDRALRRPMLFQALAWSIWSLVMLALPGRLLSDDLPRLLAMPALPGALLFLLWTMASSLIPYVMYHRFRKAANYAARTGLPCPAVTGWKRFSRINHIVMAVLLLWILSAASPVLILGYAAVLGILELLRRFLPRWFPDGEQAETLWQKALLAAILVIAALYLWNNRTTGSDEVETIPLMAQELLDTDGMQLKQFDYNDSDSPLASYHNYWQSDHLNGLDIQYTIFDQHIPLFRGACEADFLETFDMVAARDGMTVTDADAALWGAEQVFFSTKPGDDQWLIFYEKRIIHLHTSWNLTPEQIAAAAAELAP